MVSNGSILSHERMQDISCYHLLLSKCILSENQNNFLVKYGSQGMTLIASLINYEWQIHRFLTAK